MWLGKRKASDESFAFLATQLPTKRRSHRRFEHRKNISGRTFAPAKPRGEALRGSTDVKRILILTAGYGEGHNAAARGVRDGLARISPETHVEMHDLFAETYGWFHQVVRKAYAGLINRWPTAWGTVYRWLDDGMKRLKARLDR